MLKNQTETAENNSSTIGPPAGIEPTPLRWRNNALTTHLRSKRNNCVFQVVMPANRFQGKSIKILWHLTRGRVNTAG